jgi:transposase
MEFKHFIGVDVSKKTLDLVVRTRNEYIFHIQLDNNKTGIGIFKKQCKKHMIDLSHALLCMEHTGIYNTVALSEFYKLGCSVWLENAVQIKRSFGLARGKSDKMDAERISEYAFRFSDKVMLWKPSRDELIQIKHLTTLRRRFIDAKNQLKVPVTEAKEFLNRSMYNQLNKLTEKPVEALNKQIKEVENQLRIIINLDPRLAELFEIVTSVDGVGEVLFWELVTTTEEFNKINEPKKYACYSGVAPFEHSSGSSIRGKNRVSKMGNKSTKRILHLAAISSIAMKGELSDFYHRKVAEGKNKMATLNAVRNKIIHRVFACVREERKYEKIYTSSIV